jgi:hypothetical protein
MPVPALQNNRHYPVGERLHKYVSKKKHFQATEILPVQLLQHYQDQFNLLTSREMFSC